MTQMTVLFTLAFSRAKRHRAVTVGLVALSAVSCAAFDKQEPATPGPMTGASSSVEQPPPRTALSDGAYCLLPSDAGFEQVVHADDIAQ